MANNKIIMDLMNLGCVKGWYRGGNRGYKPLHIYLLNIKNKVTIRIN